MNYSQQQKVTSYDKFSKNNSLNDFNTPIINGITNKYELYQDSNSCNIFSKSNNFGNYFKSCQTPSVMWGSDKPQKESCPTDYVDHTGTPCHSLWNNMTKRKSIVRR